MNWQYSDVVKQNFNILTNERLRTVALRVCTAGEIAGREKVSMATQAPSALKKHNHL